MTIIFIPVKETSSKLTKLCQIAQKHLYEKSSLLLLVADQTSFDFLDRLLWTTPQESFLPHPNRFLSIALQVERDFHSIFNLRPTPLLDPGNAKMIFEFEDHTSSEKLQLSQQRYQSYRDKNFSIVIDTQFC